MANNRIYIKCNACGEYVSIAKSFGSGFFPNIDVDDILCDFMEKHTFCGPGFVEGDFDLVYEEAPDHEKTREIYE